SAIVVKGSAAVPTQPDGTVPDPLGDTNSGGIILDPGANTDGQQQDTGAVPAASAPTGVKASATSVGIQLNWNANSISEQVESYHVYYSEDGQSSFQRIGTVNETSFEYISPITAGYFRVTAVNTK